LTKKDFTVEPAENHLLQTPERYDVITFRRWLTKAP